MTLTAFLLARIAEDEAVARKAQRGYQHVFGIPHYFTANGDTSVAMNPRVALVECEAKRRIVEMHAAYQTPQVMSYGTITACAECGSVDDSPMEWPCPTLRALATVYADHPDYREEWRA